MKELGESNRILSKLRDRAIKEVESANVTKVIRDMNDSLSLLGPVMVVGDVEQADQIRTILRLYANRLVELLGPEEA